MNSTAARRQQSWFQTETTASINNPIILPQISTHLTKKKHQTDFNNEVSVGSEHQQRPGKSPLRLLNLPFDKIVKQAGLADIINIGTVIKGERSPGAISVNMS